MSGRSSRSAAASLARWAVTRENHVSNKWSRSRPSMLELSILDAAMPPQPDPPGGEVEVWRDRGRGLCAYGYTGRRAGLAHPPDGAGLFFDPDPNRVSPVSECPLRPGGEFRGSVPPLFSCVP